VESLAEDHAGAPLVQLAAEIAMPHAQLIQAIRRLVVDAFSRLQPTHNAEPREMILIRDGVYCGRRFDVPECYAVWTFDEDQLELFQADGSVLSVLENVSTVEPAIRKAA